MKKPVARNIEQGNVRYLIVIPLLIAAALFMYKSTSSIGALRSAWVLGTMAARPEIIVFGEQVSASSALERSANYFLVIWPALVFGILISAAVRAFVSPDWFARLALQKSMKAQLTAGLAGAPLMLCSCCTAPVFASVAERSARLGPALGLMLASPALNPAALALTFILFDPNIAVGRTVLSLLAVLLIGPIVERIFRGIKFQTTPDQELTQSSLGENAALRFLRSVTTVSVRTVPVLVAGVIASMLIVQWLPARVFASPGAGFAAIFVTATVAVPLALPTFLEIPLALGLLAAGFPSGAAVALLFAGPAVNLPSLLSIARISGWKVAGSVATMVWLFAVCGGYLIN